MNWWKSLKGKIKFKEPLKNYTTFKIGGRARFFIEPQDADDLKSLLHLVKKYKLPFFIIGRGSNLLISDRGISGVVIRLNSPYFKKISYTGGHLDTGSGVLLNEVVLFAKSHGLSGPEFLSGIPGTIGGALVMNAGISEKVQSPCLTGRQEESIVRSIGDLVEKVTVMDYDGNTKILNKKNIKFDYRESDLSKYIILSARIRTTKKKKEEIKNKIKKYVSYRKSSQDLSRPSAGCIFRNPRGESAGRLIDLCGLKGKKIKDACVSKKHANFILNLGASSSKDVLKLMDLIRKKVKHKFRINLTPEIKIWQN